MTASWCDRPLHRLADAIRTGELAVREAVEAALERIRERDAALNAFITVLAAAAAAEADAAAREIAAGRYRGPLHGVPVSIKDLVDVAGAATTAASRAPSGPPPAADAALVARLRAAGAIVVGKCNLHEFAFGTTGEDSAFGPARHPLDPDRSPGGSSSGSAVSVAAGMAWASVGTDTGGSVRIPAAACGLVGLKPTFGEVSCDGVVPLAPSLDHAGPLTRCVADARLVLRALRPAAPARPAARDPVTRRLGCPRPFFFDRLDPEVRETFETALGRLRGAGWDVRDAPVRHAEDAPAVCLHLVLAEAAAVHARGLDRHADRYSADVRLRLELGRYVMAEDYVRAQRGRAVLADAVDTALTGCDALVLPALATPAPRLGVDAVAVDGRSEPLRPLMLRLTQLFNATGHPAVSIPCGLTAGGLPCGMQLVGRRRRTDHLLDVAEACEAALSGRTPPRAAEGYGSCAGTSSAPGGRRSAS